MKSKKEVNLGGMVMLTLAVILAISLVFSTGAMAYFISGDGDIHMPGSEIESSEEVREVEVKMVAIEPEQNEIFTDEEEIKFIVENPTPYDQTLTVFNPQEVQKHVLADEKIKANNEEEVIVEMPEESQELLLTWYFDEDEVMLPLKQSLERGIIVIRSRDVINSGNE